MEKVLMGNGWNRFGVVFSTDEIGLGVNLDRFDDEKDSLISINLLFIHIYIVI